MIPRVRLTYVQGLAAAHEDLRRPREVDLTTDGTSLVVAPPASGRPLARLPLTGVAQVGVEPAAGQTTATSRLAAGLTGTESVLVLRFRPAPGVPAALAGEPLVFATPAPGGVAAKLSAVENVLRPRPPEEMARLARAERRRGLAIAVAFVLLVALGVTLLVLLLLLVVAPRPRPGAGPAVQTTIAWGG
jgi:hypothetical protein